MFLSIKYQCVKVYLDASLLVFLDSRQVHASIAGLLQMNLTQELGKIAAREAFIKPSSG